MKTTPVLRARDENDKEQRRIQILAAAETLLNVSEHALPSAELIAKKSGLGKGTLYLYYQTKEEIYFVLLTAGFARWIAVIKDALEIHKSDVDAVLKCYVRFCTKHPKTIFLASLSSVVIENNINDDSALAFKKGLAQEVIAVANLIARAVPALKRHQAARLFIQSYALTIGMWQQAHPAPVIASLLKRKDLAVLRVNFDKDLYSALKALWHGNIQLLQGEY